MTKGSHGFIADSVVPNFALNGPEIALIDPFAAAMPACMLLLVPILILVIIYLAWKMPRFMWCIVALIGKVIRDEIIKAILLALAASAGLVHYPAMTPTLQ